MARTNNYHRNEARVQRTNAKGGPEPTTTVWNCLEPQKIEHNHQDAR